MPNATKIIDRMVAEAREQRGFVQRSPIRPGVWVQFLENPGSTVSLLLIPYRSTTAGKLCVAINGLLSDLGDSPCCTYNQSVVSGRFHFETLITRILPLSSWWQRDVEPAVDQILQLSARTQFDDLRKAVLSDLSEPRASGRQSGLSPEVLWCIRMLGLVSRVHSKGKKKDTWPTAAEQLRYARKLFRSARKFHPGKQAARLFAVSRNRSAVPCLVESVRTIKGDASREVFDISCRNLTWAIVDSGIERNHPAFSLDDGGARVLRSLDFTRLGDMLELASSPDEDDRNLLVERYRISVQEVQKIGRAIRDGDDFDWEIITHALAVDAGEDNYFGALDPHGTQVAGILGAGEGGNPANTPGVCPDIRMIDLRVIVGPEGGENTEFHIISALQYIRYLNRDKDKPVVHGINLSLSLPHSVTDYGCGQTPICEECDRLVASGVVVIAAAGNYGFDQFDFGGPAASGGYRGLSITDPGNADAVITVGSTHRKYPHRYGISYFSSRGPTGDGRGKPDLVAPGESIVCPSRNRTYEACSGTSMAAPHVSGAAALLMARHQGLVGDPARIKRILCDNATDLNRARNSQGFGLVDVFRAIQSI